MMTGVAGMPVMPSAWKASIVAAKSMADKRRKCLQNKADEVFGRDRRVPRRLHHALKPSHQNGGPWSQMMYLGTWPAWRIARARNCRT